MSGDGERVHLIERAARRLDRTATWPAAETSLEVGVVDPLPKRDEQPLDAPGPAHGVDTDSAAVVDWGALKRAGMVEWSDPAARVAQEIHIVQTEMLRRCTGLNHGGAASRSKLAMITSALPGEGKSFAALNLAVGIARQEACRVLLVDADGKPGSIGDLLGLGAAPGLLDLAADRRLDPGSLAVPTCVAALEFLPLGGHGGNPAEAFGETNAARVMAALAGRYPDRLILLDAPPCLSSSRPHLLAPLVGQVVVVVAAGSTQQGDVEAALGLVHSCSGVSLLLNRVRRWHAHSFGSYAHAA